MSFSIIPYQSVHKEACMKAFKSNVPKYFTEEEVLDFEVFLDTLKVRNQSRNINRQTEYYVVLSNDIVVGCGGFGDKDGIGIISLAWGLVHADFHKQGLGEKLLLHRIEQIKKQFPGESIVIDTTQHSYPFFEKYGFQVTKFTPDFYTNGMHRYDMEWRDDV